MDIKKTLKDNLQTIIALFAVGSTIFGVFNFYLLSQLAPIERRVVALEKSQDENLPYVNQFIVLKESVANIQNNIEDIKKTLLRLDSKIDRIGGLE